MKVSIKSIDEIYLKKAFGEKEILHFATPKWTKRGVFAGEEKRREAKKLKEEGKKELAAPVTGKDVVVRQKAGGHIPYVRRIKGKIQSIAGKGVQRIKKEKMKRKIYTADKFSQKELIALVPSLAKGENMKVFIESIDQAYEDLQKAKVKGFLRTKE
jgi:hypothetical protein